MKKIIAIFVIGLFSCIFSTTGYAGDKHNAKHGGKLSAVPEIRHPKKSEIGIDAVCPVMGNKLKVSKKTDVIDYKDETYYFCCPGCPEEFKKNPDKYASAGSEAKKEVRIRKVKQEEIGKEFICPVMFTESKVKKNTYAAEYYGKTYYFCCPDCIAKFTGDPEKYANDTETMDKSGSNKIQEKINKK